MGVAVSATETTRAWAGWVGSWKAWRAHGSHSSDSLEAPALPVIVHLTANASGTVAGLEAASSVPQPTRPTARRRLALAFPWTVLVPMTPRVRGLLLLNLVCVLCASAFTVLRTVEQQADAWVFNALRFALAAAGMSPFWRGALQDEKVVRAGVDIGFWAAGGYLAQSLGLITGEASRGAFLSGMTVVATPVLAALLGGARLKRSTWAAVAASMCGIALLEDSGAPASIGDLWSFLSAILFGMQIWRAECWSKRLGSKNALPILSVTVLMTCAISLLAMLVVHNEAALQMVRLPTALANAASYLSRQPLFAMIYMGLGVTCGGLWLELVALQDISSAEAAIIYSSEPLWGAGMAYFLLDERWGMGGWFGAALIIASCLVAQLGGGAEKEHSDS